MGDFQSCTIRPRTAQVCIRDCCSCTFPCRISELKMYCEPLLAAWTYLETSNSPIVTDAKYKLNLAYNCLIDASKATLQCKRAYQDAADKLASSLESNPARFFIATVPVFDPRNVPSLPLEKLDIEKIADAIPSIDLNEKVSFVCLICLS